MITRILVGSALVLLLGSVILFGGLFQAVVFSLAAFASAYEVRHVLKDFGCNMFSLPAYAFALSFAFLNRFLGPYWMLVMFVFCVLAVVAERVFNNTRTLTDVLGGFSLFLYPLSFFMFLVLLGELGSFETSRVAVLMAFAGPCMGDTLAYFVGVSVGKRKLCPDISPKKTVEGSIGGIIGGIIGGLIVYLIEPVWGSPVPLFALLLLGLVCGVVGQIGDLFASTIKRSAGVKDFGTLFPGHGGMMDRLDSVLMCAPIMFLYFYAFHGSVAGLL